MVSLPAAQNTRRLTLQQRAPQVDLMIRAGLVELDGAVVGKAGAKLKVPEEACPMIDGVSYPPSPLLVAYHKPVS